MQELENQILNTIVNLWNNNKQSYKDTSYHVISKTIQDISKI